MAGNPLIFKDADKAKEAILASQKKEIIKLYDEWAAEIGERAKYYSHKSAPSYAVAERQMKELMKQMEATSHEVANEIYSGVKKNIYLVSDSVVQQNTEWLKSLGFEGGTIDAAFNYIPDEIVRNLITGQIYDSGWSLSKRIWSDNEETMKQAYQIVAGGIAQNKSIYEIAKDLEKYVQPGAKKPWNLVDKDGRKIYPKQVDYNAQRLGRTLVQHGYQQSFVATTQKNPFITDYIWRSNGSRVCELCISRDGQHYSKDDLPMDHPNGMCTMEPNVSENLVDDLADWFNSPDGTYPEIDEFASNFGYKAETKVAIDKSKLKEKFGTDIISAKSGLAKSGNSDAYEEFFKIAKEESKITNHKLSSFLKGYMDDEINSPALDNFFQKIISPASADEGLTVKSYLSKHGTSTKSPNAWYASLSPMQKAEAKLLKEESGLTWNKWYEKNIYVGDGTNLATKKKAAAEVFNRNMWYDKLNNNDLRKMEKWCDDWTNIATSKERYGVEVYTGSAYDDMNKYLRGLRSSTSYTDEIKYAKQGLLKASLPEETVVRRGTDFDAIKALFKTDKGSDIVPNKEKYIGMVIQDKGFMSTSPAVHGGFSGDIELIIKVPEGYQAMYVAPISRHKSEQELLINAGTKFVVEDFETNSYDKIKRVFLRVIKK